MRCFRFAPRCRKPCRPCSRGYPVDSPLKDYLQLNGQILYWLLIGPWKKQPFKVSHILNQLVRMGVEALPMVALTAFSIGLTLAMQGAHELQRMGAALYRSEERRVGKECR